VALPSPDKTEHNRSVKLSYVDVFEDVLYKRVDVVFAAPGTYNELYLILILGKVTFGFRLRDLELL
jgi:hypothetical protein